MRKFVLFLLVVSCSLSAKPQVTLWDDLARDSLNATNESRSSLMKSDVYIPDAWDINLDSLIHSWHVKHYIHDINREGYTKREPVSDSVYVERLSQLPCIIELPYNDVVRSCIDLYVDRRRNLVEYMLGLQAIYFPMIEQTLDSYGLPLELKYLAIVESALNPVALSRAGASGLWQFMLPTGKFYGLEINSLIDERRDPVKATDAACRYFKDMYDIYGDWSLVIAAYNCGSGNVNKAIKRAGGKRDYWAIYPYLPRETRSYVPFFIAANYAMNYYSYHNLYPIEASLPMATDTVMVNDMIHFDQIAAVLKIDKEEIRALNPQYKQDIIPGNSKPRPIRLPCTHAYAFVEMQNTIVSHRRDELFSNRTYIGQAQDNREKKIHKVKKGESLTTIGNKYGVTTAEIRKWNGLKSNRVGAGRNLTIYVDNGGYAENINTSSKSTTTKTPTAKSSTPKSSASATSSKKSSGTYAQYKVKSGDSYYTIARKYPGYSHTDLMRINNTKSESLRVGQVIKVPKI